MLAMMEEDEDMKDEEYDGKNADGTTIAEPFCQSNLSKPLARRRWNT